MNRRKIITPRVNERGRHESESMVDATKKESGGKRKGRSMAKRPKGNRPGYVTRENLDTGRENNGYYDTDLRCVVYKREVN
jgi:hypothetical protein